MTATGGTLPASLQEPMHWSFAVMTDLSLKTLKRLFAVSGNQCAFPDCESPIVEDSGTVTGIICHICARSRGGPRYDASQTDEERHSFPNLLLMCGRHSKLIDSEPEYYTVQLLQRMKSNSQRSGIVELSQLDVSRVELLLKAYRAIHITAGGHVMVDSPGGVQASTVVIKAPARSVKLHPPAGCIASELSSRNYIKHLIDRYHEFASKQPGRTFGYPAIYAEIKKRFGAKWDLIPIQRFGDLAHFLQRKIDRTMLGSMNRGKGIPNYSPFVEFREKYEAPSGS